VHLLLEVAGKLLRFCKLARCSKVVGPRCCKVHANCVAVQKLNIAIWCC